MTKDPTITKQDFDYAQDLHDRFWFMIMEQSVSNKIMGITMGMLMATFVKNLIANDVLREESVERYLQQVSQAVKGLVEGSSFEPILKQ